MCFSLFHKIYMINKGNTENTTHRISLKILSFISTLDLNTEHLFRVTRWGRRAAVIWICAVGEPALSTLRSRANALSAQAGAEIVCKFPLQDRAFKNPPECHQTALLPFFTAWEGEFFNWGFLHTMDSTEKKAAEDTSDLWFKVQKC